MEEKIIGYIQEELNPDLEELSTTDELLESGAIDSMGVIRLVSYLEEEFGISVPPQDMVIENFEHVDAMVKYIQEVKSKA